MNGDTILEWRDNSVFEARADDLARIKAISDQYGFCTIKGVFTADELRAIEEGMAQSPLKADGLTEPDLFSLPKLRHVMTDPRILSIARTLLGRDLVYYAETGVNYEPEVGSYTHNPFMQLHADALGGPQSLFKSWRPATSPTTKIYPAIRFGVYTRDYSKHSGGLKVLPGSHLHNHAVMFERKPNSAYARQISPVMKANLEARFSDLYNVASEPGDVVIWNLNTMHSAGALRLAIDPLLTLPPQVEQQIWLKHPDVYLPTPGPRNAIFFDFASPSEEIDFYVKSRAMTKCCKSNMRPYKTWHYDDDALLQDLAAHGIKPRFDVIIVSLALDIMSRALSPQDDQKLRSRLIKLAEANTEFSPYFTVVDKAALAKAASPQEKVTAIIDSVMKCIAQAGFRAAA